MYHRTDSEEMDAFKIWEQRLGVEPMSQTAINGSYEINTQTGEATSLVPVNEEIDIFIPPHETPEYILQLEKLSLSVDDKLALLSVYESAADNKSFKSLINTEVLIYGAIVWYHPPFKAKTSHEDDPLQPAYEQIRLLAQDKEGKPFIITASHGSLANHIGSILRLRGWYIWDTPVLYHLSQDEKTNGFRMTNAERVTKLLKAIKK